MPNTVFKRILLKLSGEALAAGQGFGVDSIRVHEIAAELADVRALDIQIAIVVFGDEEPADIQAAQEEPGILTAGGAPAPATPPA